MNRNVMNKVKSFILPVKKSLSLSFEPRDWKNAVSEAEKIVGYSTSLLSLRCLLNDEISNIATQTRKLVGTNHPILKTAQKLFQDGKQSMQTRGLMVLLISKAAGPTPKNKLLEDMVSGIYPCQRTLAEITEIIHTASLIHKSVVDLPNDNKKNGLMEDMEFGNKIAVLCGDYLLANASKNLASLYNTKVVDLMSMAIRDMMRGEFAKLSSQDEMLKGSGFLLDALSIKEWENQTFLTSGSLLARGCQGALALAWHDQNLEEAAFHFGNLMALARQFKEDLAILQEPNSEQNGFNFISMPVIIYLNKQQNPSKTFEILRNSSSQEISKIILKDQLVVEESKKLCRGYGDQAIQSLSPFGESDAKNVLINMMVNTAINQIGQILKDECIEFSIHTS